MVKTDLCVVKVLQIKSRHKLIRLNHIAEHLMLCREILSLVVFQSEAFNEGYNLEKW